MISLTLGYTIIWTKVDDNEILAVENYIIPNDWTRYNITKEDCQEKECTEYILVIKSVTTSDSGTYACTVAGFQGPGGSASVEVDVINSP